MPGLLQSPEGNFGSVKVIYALVAEFIGTMVGRDLCSDHMCKQTASRDMVRHMYAAFHFRWYFNSGVW